MARCHFFNLFLQLSSSHIVFIYIVLLVDYSCCPHCLPIGRGPPLGCRAEIWTRACRTASRRAIIWATPHPISTTPHPIWATPHPKMFTLVSMYCIAYSMGCSEAFEQELNCFYCMDTSGSHLMPSPLRRGLDQAGLDSKAWTGWIIVVNSYTMRYNKTYTRIIYSTGSYQYVGILRQWQGSLATLLWSIEKR